MHCAARLTCCLLAFVFCSSVFAQEPSLAQLQSRAQAQIEQSGWITGDLIWEGVAAVTAGSAVWAAQHIRLKRQAKQHAAETQRLKKALENATYETKTWQQQYAALNNRHNTLFKLYEQSQEITKQQLPKKLLPSQAVSAPQSGSYLYMTHTPLSRTVLTANPVRLAQLTPEELRAFVSNLDRVYGSAPQLARGLLNDLARSSAKPALTQLYIEAGKYIRGMALGALVLAVLQPQDTRAQKQLERLHENPDLFLKATPEQLQAWEQNPQTDALCRLIAGVIEQKADSSPNEQEKETAQKYASLLRKAHTRRFASLSEAR